MVLPALTAVLLHGFVVVVVVVVCVCGGGGGGELNICYIYSIAVCFLTV